MKALSRDFTKREKALILVLALILMALGYYQFIFRPTQDAIQVARDTEAALQTELDVVTMKTLRLNRMQNEVDELVAGGKVDRMPSYNNHKEELARLNEILQDTEQYSVSFANVTQDGDQIRRNFSLQFTVSDLAALRRILSQLSHSGYRCLVDDIRCVSTVTEGRTTLNASMTATFYETMVGGTPDAGLTGAGTVTG